MLIAAGSDGATVERLANELWGDDPPPRWRASVRMAVSRLRKAIGAEAIEHDGGYYRLAVARESVDVWWLDDLAESDEPVAEGELVRALSGAPFADVDQRELVRQAADQARAGQSAVVKRFCSAATTMTERTAAALATHQRDVDPFDEHLAQSIGRALVDTGNIGNAVSYLRSVVQVFESEFGFVPPALLALQVDAERSASVDSDLALLSPVAPRPIPPLLEHLQADACFGRDDETAQLLGGRPTIVLGPSGSGKSRLLAEIAAQATEAGEGVCYLSSDPALTPYGPFLAAFPPLRELLLPGTPSGDAGGPPEPALLELHRAQAAERSVAILAHLERQAADSRYWLLIDDVHSFDSASKQLVGFLARVQSASPLVLIVCGRNDAIDEEWTQLLVQLRRSGFDEITIGALPERALEALLDELVDGLTVSARTGLVSGLLTRNAALPAVARSLIQAVDPETKTFDSNLASYDPERWVQPAAGLDRGVADVAVGAAVLGITFTVSELVELLGVDEETVVDALETLWDLGRIVDADAPDRLRFRDALVRDAFLRAAPSFRLLRLHKRAAELSDDLHAIADHQAAAVPEIDRSVAAASLVASARAFMASGSWHDAVGRLRAADAVTEGGLDVDALVLMARALDLSGAGGAGPRNRAYRRAVAEGRWAEALHAALSGLPEAEQPDGDQARIAMLLEIPPDRIAAEDALARAEALARQYALDGQPAEAMHWASLTAELATDRHQRARAEIARWSANHHITAIAYEFPDDLVEGAADRDRAQMLEMRALCAVERGDYGEGNRCHHRFAALADAIGDPVRIWQSKVLGALLALDDGRWTESGEQADEAFDYGTRHGMRHAPLAWTGHNFMKHWIAGTLGGMTAAFESMRVDVGTSSVAEAARALVLAADDRERDAWSAAEPVVRDALDRPRSPAIVVLAMLSGLVASHGDRYLKAGVRARLLPFAGRSVVAGYGIGNVGPVWRALAPLADDDGQRLEWLHQARQQADGSGAALWRVVARVDLAWAGGGQAHRADAAALAEGTDLAGRLVAP